MCGPGPVAGRPVRGQSIFQSVAVRGRHQIDYSRSMALGRVERYDDKWVDRVLGNGYRLPVTAVFAACDIVPAYHLRRRKPGGTGRVRTGQTYTGRLSATNVRLRPAISCPFRNYWDPNQSLVYGEPRHPTALSRSLFSQEIQLLLGEESRLGTEL